MFVLIGRYVLHWQKIKLLSLFVQLLLEYKISYARKSILKMVPYIGMNHCHCLSNATVLFCF